MRLVFIFLGLSTVGIKAEKTDTIAYYSGKAAINLFVKEVKISRPDLKNGERITKEHFLIEFRGFSFYKNLTGSNEL